MSYIVLFLPSEKGDIHSVFSKHFVYAAPLKTSAEEFVCVCLAITIELVATCYIRKTEIEPSEGCHSKLTEEG